MKKQLEIAAFYNEAAPSNSFSSLSRGNPMSEVLSGSVVLWTPFINTTLGLILIILKLVLITN